MSTTDGAAISPARSDAGDAGELNSGYLRTMTWRDGFSMALVVPVAIFASIGPSIAGIGSGSVAVIFGIACTLAILQNLLYAEMASMFPDKAGGITLYAHEAWKRYFTPLGAMTAFGYWAGWSLANAVFALTVGDLIQAQFFPDTTWTLSTGTTEISLPHVIAIVLLVGIWVLNIVGVKSAVFLNKVLGVLAVGLIILLGVVPFITGDFQSSNVTWGLGLDGQTWGGWQIGIVFYFIFSWSAYGTEGVATFGPEYKDRKRDLRKALLTSCVFTLIVAVLMPLGLGGTVGDAAIAADPGGVFATAFAAIVGPVAPLVTVLIALSLCLVMNSVTATAGRSLHGMAVDGLSVKQLDNLNARAVPARAMLVGLILNVCTVLFMGNVLAIIFTANIGYVFATVVVLIGFLLLRKDRPSWPRPFRVSRAMVPVAVAMVVINAIALIVGFAYPSVGGYGGVVEQVVGVVIIASSLLLYVYRRRVQDHGTLQLRDRSEDQAPQLDPARD